jgi:hypothetical protein
LNPTQGSCCKIKISAEGFANYEYVDTNEKYGNHQLTPLQHETTHLRQFYFEWQRLKSSVIPYENNEMLCEKAVCYTGLIKLLKDARHYQADAVAYRFDYDDGQTEVWSDWIMHETLAEIYFGRAIDKKIQCDAM